MAKTQLIGTQDSATPSSHISKDRLALILDHHAYLKQPILKDIDLTLSIGESLAIIGPSGSGKSTLLRLCAGFMPPSAGVLSSSFTDQAFVFQDSRLLPWFSALDNAAFALKGRGVKRSVRQHKARQIAYQLNLSDADLNKYPADLSGGMQQRVAFARALVLDAPLMLLDEPFSALDFALKQHIMQLLTTIIIKRQKAMLLVTHDVMEAVRLAHHIIVLAGSPATLCARFSIERPLHTRDDDYVYHTAARLLASPAIKHAFDSSIRIV